MTEAMAQGASDLEATGPGGLVAYLRTERRPIEGPATERASGLADREIDLAIIFDKIWLWRSSEER